MTGRKREIVEFGLEAHRWTYDQLKAGVLAADVAKSYIEFFKKRGYYDNYLYGPCHGTGLIEVEAPWMESISNYHLAENMTFQVDTFVSTEEFGIRWETGVAIRKDRAELLSQPIGKIFRDRRLVGQLQQLQFLGGSIAMQKSKNAQQKARRPATDHAFDVVFGFDMETDIGSFTPFYEGVKHGTPQLLKLLKKHGIRATFFWTGHAAENNPDMVRRVRDAGHETGCHGLYHETLGDPIFPLPNNWPHPALGGGRPAARGHADRAGSERRAAGEFSLPAALGQHARCSTCWRSWATWPTPRSRCTSSASRSCPITRRPRIGRGRAGCGSWKSPISATSA